MKRYRAAPRRNGTAVVEMSFIVPILVMVMFGIFEYGRFVFVYQTCTNAVRHGAHFASSHTDPSGVIDGSGTYLWNPIVPPGPPYATPSTGDTQIYQIVNNAMGGVNNILQGYEVRVFYVDPAGLALTPPVVQPANGEHWTTTPFGRQIAVRIRGNYIPTMVAIVKMNTTIPLEVVAMFNSEKG